MRIQLRTSRNQSVDDMSTCISHLSLSHATLIPPPAPLALISHATRLEEKKLDLGRFSTPPDRDNRAFWTI
jgi:hypothetical protein